MKAMEYWKCSETGITSGNSQESIRFVLVESLKGQGNVIMHACMHESYRYLPGNY